MTLCVTLAACNNNQTVKIDDNSADLSPPASPTASATVTDTPAEPDNPADNLDDMYNAYFTALENLIQNHILPGGIDGGEQSGDMSENKFAVYDVDNDGKEELIILYTTTITAGMAGYIFAYDNETGVLQTKLHEFPSLTFYDNGIIKAVDASEYNEWINAHIGDASEIQIQYMDLMEENISQIRQGRKNPQSGFFHQIL